MNHDMTTAQFLKCVDELQKFLRHPLHDITPEYKVKEVSRFNDLYKQFHIIKPGLPGAWCLYFGKTKNYGGKTSYFICWKNLMTSEILELPPWRK